MAKKIIERKENLLTSSDDGLIFRHQAFIEFYLECFNGTQAWQLAHPDADYDTCSSCSSRLLRNVKIKAELERRFSERVMSKNEVLTRLQDQANATLLPFVKVDDDGYIYFNFKDPEAKKHFHLIKKVKHKKQERWNEKSGEGSSENWVEVELHDPQKALELIGKYYALFTDKMEHDVKHRVIHVGFEKPSEESNEG
jgi:hypothetical protein